MCIEVLINRCHPAPSRSEGPRSGSTTFQNSSKRRDKTYPSCPPAVGMTSPGIGTIYAAKRGRPDMAMPQKNQKSPLVSKRPPIGSLEVRYSWGAYGVTQNETGPGMQICFTVHGRPLRTWRDALLTRTKVQRRTENDVPLHPKAIRSRKAPRSFNGQLQDG